MRIPIANRDVRPVELQVIEAKEMGIEFDPCPMLWRESTPQEDYLQKLEESLLP